MIPIILLRLSLLSLAIYGHCYIRMCASEGGVSFTPSYRS